MIDLSIIQNITVKTPADDVKISNVENELRTVIPEAYKELLRISNGFSIGGGILFYSTEEIVERNVAWEVGEYAKGYIGVGDDGGGSVFLMESKVHANKLFSVDSGDMNPQDAVTVCSDFSEWLATGCPIAEEYEDKISPSHAELCDIILTHAPEGGSKDLVQIKNILKIDRPIVELLKGSKSLPFTLLKSITYGKALARVGKLGDLRKGVEIINRS